MKGGGRTSARRPSTWNNVREPTFSNPMLKWAAIFLIISLIAGALGFSGVAAGAGRISKILFAVFLGLFFLVVIVALLLGQALF